MYTTAVSLLVAGQARAKGGEGGGWLNAPHG